MTKLHLRSLLLLLALGLCTLSQIACQRGLKPEESCDFVQNSDAQRVSWKDGLPISLYIHDSVPLEAYPSIEAAMDVYAQVFGRQVFVIRGVGVTEPSSPRRDGYSVVYWMNHWEPERRDEQGRTTVYWSGDRIYEADLRINAFSFRFHYTQNSASSNGIDGVDLKSLMVHELGHVLGLDHTDAPKSVMNTRLAAGIERTRLSVQDRANLACEYH